MQKWDWNRNLLSMIDDENVYNSSKYRCKTKSQRYFDLVNAKLIANDIISKMIKAR